MSIIVACPEDQEHSLSLGTILGPKIAFEVLAKYGSGTVLEYPALEIPPSRLQRSNEDVLGLKKHARTKQCGKILH